MADAVRVGTSREIRAGAACYAVATYRAIPDAELMVVPGTSHGLLLEKPDLCNNVILEFLTEHPVPTMAPIRRATQQ